MILIAQLLALSRAITTAEIQYLTATFTYLDTLISPVVTAYNSSSSSACSLNSLCADSFMTVPTLSADSKVGVQTSKSSVSSYRVDKTVAITTAQSQQSCRFRNMISSMNTLYNNNTVGIQYAISNASKILNAFPAFTSTSDCTQDPKTSSEYDDALTPQKNLIILIDIANVDTYSSNRLIAVKAAAKDLIDSLSNQDFFAVVPYAATAYSQMPYLIAGSSSNKVLMKNFVDNLALKTQPVQLDLAFNTSYTIILNSKANNYSVTCTPDIWVLLSSGVNQISVYEPQRFIYNIPNPLNVPVVLSYVISPGNPNPQYIVPGLVACMTSGLIYVITDITKIKQVQGTFFGYLNANWNSRYGLSLVHNSIFIPGNKVVSMTYPIYINNVLNSVYSTEILYNSISKSGSVSEESINTFVANSALCPLYTFNKDVQTKFNGNYSCQTILSFPSGLILPLQAAKGAVGGVLGAFFFIQIFIIGGYFCYKCVKDNEGYEKSQIYSCLAILNFITVLLCIWFFINLFLGLYEDFIAIYYYLPVTATVQLKVQNPYTCCDIINCSCTNAGSSPSCSSRLAGLTEGSCGNGYYCCNQFCTSYKCGKSSRCSRCYCVSSVSNRLCNSKCGNCYRPYVTFKFVDQKNAPYVAKVSGSCGRDDTNCLNNYLSTYPQSGKTYKIYYNPIDPTQAKENLVPNVVATVFFSICCFLLAVVYALMIRQCLKLRTASDDINNDPNDQNKGIDDNPVLYPHPPGNSDDDIYPKPGNRPYQGSPDYPGTQPAYPGTQPAYPGTQPAYPGTQPAYPGMQPAYPGNQPAYPGIQPAYPGIQPGYPGMQPGYPGMQPGYNQPVYPGVQPYPAQPIVVNVT